MDSLLKYGDLPHSVYETERNGRTDCKICNLTNFYDQTVAISRWEKQPFHSVYFLYPRIATKTIGQLCEGKRVSSFSSLNIIRYIDSTVFILASRSDSTFHNCSQQFSMQKIGSSRIKAIPPVFTFTLSLSSCTWIFSKFRHNANGTWRFFSHTFGKLHTTYRRVNTQKIK